MYSIRNIWILLSVCFLTSCNFLPSSPWSVNTTSSGVVVNSWILIKKEILSEEKISKEQRQIDSNSDKALQYIKQNYEITKWQSPRNLTNLIQVLNDLWKYDEVLIYWNKHSSWAETNFVNFSTTIWNVIIAYIFLNDYTEADKLIEKYIIKYPVLDRLKWLVAFKNKKYSEAIKLFETNKNGKVYSPSLLLMAISYDRMGNSDKSIATLQSLWNLEATGDGYYINKFMAYRELIRIYTTLWDSKNIELYNSKFKEISTTMRDGNAIYNDDNGEVKILYSHFEYIITYLDRMIK